MHAAHRVTNPVLLSLADTCWATPPATAPGAAHDVTDTTADVPPLVRREPVATAR